MTESTILTDQERQFVEAIKARHTVPVGSDRVIAEVADLFGITVDRLLSESRKAYITDARCVAVHLLIRRNLTHEQIGELLNRNPSTINHYAQRLAKDFDLRRLAKEMAA